MDINQTYELLLNIKNLRIDGVDLFDRKINIYCGVKSKEQACPNCGKMSKTVHQYYVRRLRDLDISSREVYLHVKERQFHCKYCNRYFTELLDFADLNKDHTLRQAKRIFEFALKLSYAEVGAIFNIHAKTVERIVLSKCEKVIDIAAGYKAVSKLGIDELSHRKGKKDFICIVTDLDRGVVLDLLPNRKMTTLIAHFQALGMDFCAQIEYVACDFWDAYITTSEKCFPNAKIVIDHFHVVKLLNDPLDALRKKLRKEDKDNLHYLRLKWILYRQYHTLSDAQLNDLEAAFADSPLLKQCYNKREEFHHILDNEALDRCGDPAKKALEKITIWIDSMAKEGITLFDGFVKTLTKSKEYIANYVVDFVTNAATEGLNNLIRSVKRIAWGMPNFNHLRLRVLAMSN